VALPSPSVFEHRRKSTYRQRSLFLIGAAPLVVLAHAVDVAQAGGANWAALALRLAWALVLLSVAWALRRATLPRLRAVVVAACMATAPIYLALIWLTGRSSSPLFSFAFGLGLVLPIVVFDMLPVALVSSALLLGGASAMTFFDRMPTIAVLGWTHVAVVVFAAAWLLGLAFRRTQNDNERLIQDLREALANVKTLKGLLPVCAWCHKVRDDDGYWQRIDAYVSAHSEAEFTHSMCPECYARRYPEGQ
jgi:hypothetical protein